MKLKSLAAICLCGFGLLSVVSVSPASARSLQVSSFHKSLNPQPLPPVRQSVVDLVSLNPQPLPPGIQSVIRRSTFNPQPDSPGIRSSIRRSALNPQTEPPGHHSSR